MTMNRQALVLAFSFLAALAPLSGCCSPTEDDASAVVRRGDVVSGTGTVRYFATEGGFHAILGDDQQVYDPIDLAPEFRRDGLRVRFSARVRTDVGSFHLVGTVVEIREIAAL